MVVRQTPDHYCIQWVRRIDWVHMCGSMFYSKPLYGRLTFNQQWCNKQANNNSNNSSNKCSNNKLHQLHQPNQAIQTN